MADAFSCPTCGAPLTVKNGDQATISCPFCGASVIVPAELRQKQIQPDAQSSIDALLMPIIRDLLDKNQKIEAIRQLRQYFPIGLKEAKDAVDEIEAGQRSKISDLSIYLPHPTVASVPVVTKTRINKVAATLITLLIIGAVTGLGILLVSSIDKASKPATSSLPATLAPSATPLPSPSPTPQFASLVTTLGSEGTGAGKFTQANSLAVDRDGYMYVGDYNGNRVQVFDPSGKFVIQWALDPNLHIRHLAAGLNGEIYANQSGRIFRYDPKTGDLIGEIQYQDIDGDIDDFDNLAVALDGSLWTSWINDTLETGKILQFDSSGNLLQTIENPIKEQTGSFETHISLAVHGSGDIYALGEINQIVCVFSPQGKFINRFGGRGDNAGQFRSAQNIAIDSRGRVYVAAFTKVQVFDSSGLYLNSFDTEGGAFGMTFDANDNLYLLGSTKLMKYSLNQ